MKKIMGEKTKTQFPLESWFHTKIIANLIFCRNESGKSDPAKVEKIWSARGKKGQERTNAPANHRKKWKTLVHKDEV